MERAGFLLSMTAGFFSVFLLGWRGYQGVQADWVYGFLAAFWSLIMMLRVMTLTAPAEPLQAASGLAQEILGKFREQQKEDRQIVLENAFGGSFFLFLVAGLVFAAWQIFCAAYPAQHSGYRGLDLLIRDFFTDGSGLLFLEGQVFDWGQGFLLLLALAMMGFVMRSHAARKEWARPALLVLCSYAAAGYIVFAGLETIGGDIPDIGPALTGNGSGAAAFLLGSMPPGKVFSLFDIVLLESGLAGLAILTFILFVPLGCITLSAQGRDTDWMIVICGMMAGSILILSAFLPFTPALGGFIGLCWMAVFLAWGSAENGFAAIPA